MSELRKKIEDIVYGAVVFQTSDVNFMEIIECVEDLVGAEVNTIQESLRRAEERLDYILDGDYGDIDRIDSEIAELKEEENKNGMEI